jgi:hypothetical protein
MQSVCSHFSIFRLLFKSILGDGLESLFDIDGFLGGSFEIWDVTLCRAPGHCTFLRNYALVLNINFVTKNDEWEVVGISWSGLNQELISPAVEVLESLCNIDIKHKNTAISTSVESNTKTLETLLSGSIPNLNRNKGRKRRKVRICVFRPRDGYIKILPAW